jgi:hypothetical protein
MPEILRRRLSVRSSTCVVIIARRKKGAYTRTTDALMKDSESIHPVMIVRSFRVEIEREPKRFL